jgi:hypothetical protein
MADKPIIFSAPMVRALLEGRTLGHMPGDRAEVTQC